MPIPSTSAERKLKLHGYALRISVATLGLLMLLLFSTLVVSLIAQERKPIAPAKRPAAPQHPNLHKLAPNLPPVIKSTSPGPNFPVKQPLPDQLRSKSFHA